MTESVRPFAVLLLTACATGHPGAVTPSAPESAAARSLPDSTFGIVLRKPLNAGAFTHHRCFGAREFAFLNGAYSIVSDDVLFGVPHEHQDTGAVLAALDSFTVCAGQTRELNALAFVTLSDSVVGHALVFWPEEGQAPDYARLLAMLQRIYGESLENEHRVRYWSVDSMKLYVNRRGPYNDAATVSLGDARVCERFERLVHRERAARVYTDPRSNHCWVKPEAIPPERLLPPVALADSDLTIEGLAYGADSSDVRRALGPPAAVDSVSWTYPDLRVSFTGARVFQIALTTSERTTARGLRVGDPVTRATALYGGSCAPGIYVFCRTLGRERDVRGILLQVQDSIITSVHIGAIFTYN